MKQENGMNRRILATLSLLIVSLLTLSTTWGTQTAPLPITAENAASAQQLALFEGHTAPVFALAFSPDGTTLASGGSHEDHTVRLWDITTFSEKALLEGHTGQIAAVGFNTDGTQIESASYDWTIRLWDAATGAELDTISESANGLELKVGNLATFFRSDGAQLVYYGDSGLGIEVFDFATNELRTVGENVPELADLFGSANIVNVSADGSIAAVEIPDGEAIHLIDLETGAEIQTLERSNPDSFYFSAIAISPDNSMLAAVDDTSSIIEVWNLETGEPGPLLSGHAPNDDGTRGVWGLAFNPDGTLLASASYDQTVRIWDVTTGTELVSLTTSDDSGSGVVVWSPDGSLLASANLDGNIQLWGVVG
jgi:WD40 repeat protein